MQLSIKVLLCYIFLLLHLPAMAGEAIFVKDPASLQPAISIQVSEMETEMLNSDGLVNADKVLAIYMVMNGIPAATPVAGQYSIEKNILSFVPFYTLGYDTEFEAQYKNGSTVIASKRFRTPKHPLSDRQANVVTAYPLSDTIPYNTLYFHIRFDQPMMPDKQAYRHIQVYDDMGVERTNAWRQKSFWLDDGKLLVLMIHPGRVKNGIHYESPLFDSGRYYTIKADTGLQDMNGNAIATAYTQRYYVKGEDRQSPIVNRNTLILPKANTMKPLVISFSEGMDNASVLDGINVWNAQGAAIPCKLLEKGADNTFTITPSQPWTKGTYTLSLKGAIYDFAGNRINRLFEITDVADMASDKKETRLDFTIK